MILKMIAVIFSLIDLLVIVGCSVSIVHAIPQEKETQRWKKIAAWGIYATLATVIPIFLRNDIITTVVLTGIYVAIGRLFYYKNKMGMLYQIIFWMLLMTTQYMGAYTTFIVIEKFQLEMALNAVALIAIRSVLLMAATFVMKTLLQKRFVKEGRHLKIRGMILVPIFSMVLMLLYVVSSEVFLIRYGYGWIFLFGSLLIVINVYCLHFWYDVAKNRELKYQLNLMQQQSSLTLQYYEDLEDNYARSRKIIHDIRNHLAVIEQAGKMEKSSYLDDLHTMLNSLGMKFYTDTRILNIVLNDKLKEFGNGKAECRLGGVSLDFISDIDLTTIFANLLDNAIEAQPDAETRSIRILGEQIHDFTVIKLTNPYDGACKQDHEGLGLRNVQSAVEKYQGEMQIEQENRSFSVTLVFPNSMENKKNEMGGYEV